MAYNESVEIFRDDEYPMIKGKVYLDHAGATLYTKSLVEQFSAKMISNLYGNPHSASDSATLSVDTIDAVREKALRFLGADPEHFDLVFTSNATAAIKLVAESFRDLASANSTAQNFWYGHHKDAHTSLVGIREYTGGTFHCFSSDGDVEDWLQGRQQPSTTFKSSGVPGLFAYPGQSNMTGRRLPLAWTRQLRQSSIASHQDIYSLVDAAALATTTQLDFSDPDAAPDFTTVAFYKIFGFPDLGGLIVRKKSGHIMTWRKYFGGGTVNMLTVLHEATVQRKDNTIHDGLEDGTLPFHSIMALGCAIDDHKRLYGSMKTISQHTAFLAQRLYAGLSRMSYPDGRSLCKIYCDNTSGKNPYTDPETQGATISFSVVKSDGTYVGHTVVEQLANSKGIYLRAGALCNPGGIASYLKIEPWQFKRAWSAGYRFGGNSGPLEIINGKPTGVVRVSLGAMSTMDDVDSLLYFLLTTFVEVPKEDTLQNILETFRKDSFKTIAETPEKDSETFYLDDLNDFTPTPKEDDDLVRLNGFPPRQDTSLIDRNGFPPKQDADLVLRNGFSQKQDADPVHRSFSQKQDADQVYRNGFSSKEDDDLIQIHRNGSNGFSGKQDEDLIHLNGFSSKHDADMIHMNGFSPNQDAQTRKETVFLPLTKKGGIFATVAHHPDRSPSTVSLTGLSAISTLPKRTQTSLSLSSMRPSSASTSEEERKQLATQNILQKRLGITTVALSGSDLPLMSGGLVGKDGGRSRTISEGGRKGPRGRGQQTKGSLRFWGGEKIRV